MALSLKRLVTGSRQGKLPLEKVEVGIPGKPLQAVVWQGKIYIYNPQGQALVNGGIVSANAIEAKAISANKVTSASKQFILNLTWINTAYNQVSWNAGSIYWADGTTTTINSGNTGAMSQLTYVYYDNSSILQKTTDYTQITGNNKVLISAIQPGALGDLPIITVFLSTGTTIDGDKVVTGKIQSPDGRTYFDLDAGTFVINDGSNNVIAIYP
jgi:hypothetical protein